MGEANFYYFTCLKVIQSICDYLINIDGEWERNSAQDGGR